MTSPGSARCDPVRDSGVKRLVAQEQVRLLYHNLPVSQVVTIVNGAVLALVQSSVVNSARTLTWLACLVLVALTRMLVAVLYARASPASKEMDHWRAYFLAGSCISGLIWGSSALLLYPAGSPPHEVFLAFVLAGMVAGSVTVLTPVYSAFAIFAAAALLPIAVRYLLVGDALHDAMGAMAAVFFFAMLVVGKRIHSTIAQSLLLHFDNAQLVQELRASNEELERRVIERTSALQQQDRRKDEFLATLAHELRNPLAPLASSVEIMKLRHNDPVIVARVNAVMERQVRQMTHLMDDLLDVSRISRGKVQLRRSLVDLAVVIEHALEDCRPFLGARHIEAIMPIHEAIYVHGDAARLTQVFGNLLNNACKFTAARGNISVWCERRDDKAVVSVKDDGAGIPPEKLDTVFEMFEQLDGPTERAAGLGLGLALVKQLVGLHGGTVTAHSEGPAHGAEFIVCLPTTQAPSAVAPAHESNAAAPRRVLVVDDNRDAAQSLSMLLALEGNETDVAYDGREALEKARVFKPDMVLLDIGMPGMNGYETCRALRREWCNAVRVVALSGWGQDLDRRMSQEAGFDAHLVKPATHEAITTLLRCQGGNPNDAGGMVPYVGQLRGTSVRGGIDRTAVRE